MALMIAYGLTINFGQFSFLFNFTAYGIPVGLALLILLIQAFLLYSWQWVCAERKIPASVPAWSVHCFSLVNRFGG